MRAGQCDAAQRGMIGQHGLGEVGADQRQTAVLQLTDVALLVVAAILGPAEEDIRHRLHHPLPHHHPLSLIAVDAGSGVGRQDGCLGFLQLQQQGLVVRRDEQSDGAERADTADTDDLEGDVGKLVSIQQDTPLLRQRQLIGLEGGAGDDFVGVVALARQRQDQRRLFLDAPVAFRPLDQLGVAAVPGLDRDVQPLHFAVAQFFVGDAAQHIGHVDAGPPGLQRREPHQFLHVPPVGLHRRACQVARGSVTEVARQRVDRKTGGEALDVPLERGGQGFVEIVEVEHRRALGRGERAEIGQMAVARGLHPQPGHWCFSQVGRHDGSGAAEKRQRGGAHAVVADRQQVGDAVAARIQQDVDRITPRRRGDPVCVEASRYDLAKRLTGLTTLHRGQDHGRLHVLEGHWRGSGGLRVSHSELADGQVFRRGGGAVFPDF